MDEAASRFLLLQVSKGRETDGRFPKCYRSCPLAELFYTVCGCNIDRQRLHALEPKRGKVKAIDEDVVRPNRIVIADIVIKQRWKQCALARVYALDEPRHRSAHRFSSKIIAPTEFSHTLGSLLRLDLP